MARHFMRDCGDGYTRADAGSLSPVTVKTAAYTIKATDAGTCFSNSGAEASVTFTLPTAKAGMFFRLFRTTIQDVVFTATGGAKINGGDANGSVTHAESTPGLFLIASDGTDWIMTQEATATLAGLEQGTDGQLIIGQTGAAPAYATVSGDATLSAAGALTIGANKVTMAKFVRGTDGQIVIGQTGADAAYTAVSGDVALLKTGVATVKFAGVSPKGTVVPHAAGAAVAAADIPKIHTNTGAGGAVTLTIPAAAACSGLHMKLQVTAAQEFRVDPDGTEKIYLGGDGAAGKYLSIAGVIGNYADLYCDGTDWLVIGYSGVLTKEG